jgi:hypothetical protein
LNNLYTEYDISCMVKGLYGVTGNLDISCMAKKLYGVIGNLVFIFFFILIPFIPWLFLCPGSFSETVISEFSGFTLSMPSHVFTPFFLIAAPLLKTVNHWYKDEGLSFPFK